MRSPLLLSISEPDFRDVLEDSSWGLGWVLVFFLWDWLTCLICCNFHTQCANDDLFHKFLISSWCFLPGPECLSDISTIISFHPTIWAPISLNLRTAYKYTDAGTMYHLYLGGRLTALIACSILTYRIIKPLKGIMNAAYSNILPKTLLL